MFTYIVQLHVYVQCTCNTQYQSKINFNLCSGWFQWMQLKQRKAQMVRLFQRLQDYQFEKVREHPDKALTEDTRPLSEDDITRYTAVGTCTMYMYMYMCVHAVRILFLARRCTCRFVVVYNVHVHCNLYVCLVWCCLTLWGP